METSVSLPEDDIEFLDERSAVIQRAIRMLRAAERGPAYADAWAEWQASGDAEVWVRASEASKLRPGVVVSNDGANSLMSEVEDALRLPLGL